MTRLADHRQIDPSKIPDSAWKLIEVTPLYRRYQCVLDDYGSYVIKTDYVENDKLIDQNKELHNDSYGQRFGDGKVVARIPMNVLYDPRNQIIEKMQQGDDDHLKWVLNSDKFRPFRTFRGHI